jgi:hypothetical protein
MDIQVLNALINKAERWHYERKYYLLFSKSGFTRGLQTAAQKATNIRLFGLRDMYVF